MIAIGTILLIVFMVVTVMGIGMFLVAVINIISLFALFILAPLLFKVLYDYFLTYKLDVDRRLGLLFALVGTITIVIIMYIWMFWLVFGGIIIVALYIYITRKLPSSAKIGGLWDSFREWFGRTK